MFRIWATNVLRDHLVKGYTINEKRLIENEKKFLDLQKTVRTLTSLIHKKELSSAEVQAHGKQAHHKMVRPFDTLMASKLTIEIETCKLGTVRNLSVTN